MPTFEVHLNWVTVRAASVIIEAADEDDAAEAAHGMWEQGDPDLIFEDFAEEEYCDIVSVEEEDGEG